MTVESYIGWTVSDWISFHKNGDDKSSLNKLLQVLKDQDSKDPAWISLATEEIITSQWKQVSDSSLPLYGVPIAIKDNIDVQEFNTTAACAAYSYTPKSDATTVKLLRAAGAIIIGKTNLDQFATGLVGTRSPFGITPNTFNSDYVSGGSSSGSASVVARGIVPIALGTDTAGSGRVPAGLNNLIGLKPSKGIFSTFGVIPACKSLDCVSVFSLTLADAQLALELLVQEDDKDVYSRAFVNPKREFVNPNIAIPSNLKWYGESENETLFKKALPVFETLGKTSTIDISPLYDLASCLYDGPWVAERYTAIKDFLKTNPSGLDPVVEGIIKSGADISAATTFDFEYKRQGLLKQIAKLLADVDVLVVPTSPLNPSIKQVQDEPVKVNSYQGTYTNFVNLADMSALAIPAGFRSDGLPFGITLLSQKFNDYALLEIAGKFLKGFFGDERTFGCLPEKRSSQIDTLSSTIPKIDYTNKIKLAVVGAHLKGHPLHWQLQKCNASFIESTTTSKSYKLYALPKTGPVAKPGLRRVDHDGSSIVVETYAIPTELFGQFISMVPEPLGIGSVELESGDWVKSFICEEFGYNLPGTVEITSFGGWDKYQKSIEPKKASPPFKSVLVANRGEIAVRIIKTLKKMGIKSIAIYSDLDKYAKHVEIADVAIPLHGNSAAETYINLEKVIEAAKESGAEAIIPGYGFLSENADFSDRCGKEGIVFVGPSGDAIRKLGLKHSAREIAEKAGVPLVPGSGLIKDAAEAKKIAGEIGYPVMVKSTAGGGGIGLQKVDSESEIERVFQTVQHQGKSYFGDSGVFIERFVEKARHVEIQMFGDGYGKAIAIGERDCSLQRRNQKVIEETPAPNLPEATRSKMRKASESLASIMNYKCAGTVEFIYDEVRDEFYFLEVNARLQVEHPVTEMVTGLDLVEWMLLIAADTPPDFDVKVEVKGASMEARLYAENPVKDFMPSPGQLTEVKFPEWARIDGWVEKGTTISAEYDPTLAKIIVHGKDRDDALKKLRQALDETVVYGCITNVDYLRSIANSTMFAEAKVATKVLDDYDYQPTAFEILDPGAYTTVQDFPGRKGYWHIGVPPSGCMDEYSFRIGNRIVGNDAAAPGIEITLNGPKVLFHHDVVISVTGGDVDVQLNDKSVSLWAPISIKRGDKLSIGKLKTGCRAYLAIRGGIDVTEYLGSRSTFALGNLGGYNGRVLKFGDVLFLGQPELSSCTLPVPISAPTEIPKSLIPSYTNQTWEIGVTCGPHGFPDFFKQEYIEEFFNETWKIHYNSNRFGVRLIGPKPKWARPDGGEAGLHPSNAHDYVYSLGAINFTGDEPVILTCDGPSLGGFVCAAVVAEAEMWKIGQVKPGDQIKFFPLSWETAKSLKLHQDQIIEELEGDLPTFEGKVIKPESPVLHEFKVTENAPTVTYRQAGDRYILIEYGENVLDLNLSYRIHKLMELVNENKTAGIVEMSQGVRSVLIEFDANVNQADLLKSLIYLEKQIVFVNKWEVKSRIVKLPMAFEDQKTLDAVTRYQETIRSDAPWLPNNVDFIADVNGIERNDVKDMLYTARFLVLGLGDVFLGAPCAVPLDPRHRLLGTKYNPSRTYTPNGTVGIGGNYMCIYTMDSPGGYQLVGRTVPIWDKLTLGEHSGDKPWLLSPFDQVEFYPASEADVDKFTELMNCGKFEVDIVDSVFNHGDYLKWVQANSEEIEKFQQAQGSEKLQELNRLIQVSNAELQKSEAKPIEEESFGEDAQLVYSEFTGRFWKSLVEVGDEVKTGQALVVVEAMKTEMVVTATKPGKVVKIVHKNGDMVDAGDMVVVLE